MLVHSMMRMIVAFIEKLNPPLKHSRKILESHREILEAMKKGDIGEASKKIDEHILFFGKEFRKLMPLQRIDSNDLMKAQHWLENILD